MMKQDSLISNVNFSTWPYFGDDEIAAVCRVLKSGKVNQWTGTDVTLFEKEYAEYVGIKHAIALANGSVALDLALIILGIGPGDEVIVTPRTFVASVSCISLRGATPVFVDVDPVSQNMSMDNIRQALSPKTKAIIAVHLAGWPCLLDELRRFCDEEGIFLIEDCAQAHGARYKGRPVGSIGDIGVFSFCQDKILTTGGEGGLLVTNNSELWEMAWSYKDHGKDYKRVFYTDHLPGFRWFVSSLGTNYRMTEMQAAIGRVVLKKLDAWVEKRRTLANILTRGFEKIPALRVTKPGVDIYHSYYKYYVFVEHEKLKDGWNRDRILLELEKKGIPCSTGICPEVYLEEVYQNAKTSWRMYTEGINRLPVAKKLGETSLMFMVHPTLSEENMFYVVEEMKKIIKK